MFPASQRSAKQMVAVLSRLILSDLSITMQEQMDDAAGAEATLTAALDWWRGSMTAEPAAASAAQLWILRRLVCAIMQAIAIGTA